VAARIAELHAISRISHRQCRCADDIGVSSFWSARHLIRIQAPAFRCAGNSDVEALIGA